MRIIEREYMYIRVWGKTLAVKCCLLGNSWCMCTFMIAWMTREWGREHAVSARCSDFLGVTLTGRTSDWRANSYNHAQGFTSHLWNFHREQLRMPDYQSLCFVSNYNEIAWTRWTAYTLKKGECQVHIIALVCFLTLCYLFSPIIKCVWHIFGILSDVFFSISIK